MRTSRVALVSAAVAHALAWAAFLFVLLVPAYEVEMAEATLPGEQPADAERTTESFADVNGLYGVAAALLPVVMTGAAVLGTLALGGRLLVRLAVLGTALIAVLAFCFAAILSIGLLYVPAAVALTVAALADVAHRPDEA